MKKRILLLLTVWLFIQPLAPALAQENDPVAQCARGVELFDAYKDNEAFPLLEAGFTGRENATFSDINDLGLCALALGILRDGRSDWDNALKAYAVAQELFSQTGARGLEGTTLNNIAHTYDSQGQYEEALTTYSEALAIYREVGDRAGEGTTFNNIAAVYQFQGQYEEALTTYFEALAISREVGDRAGEGITLNNIAEVYRSQERYEEALTTYFEALAISREVSDRASEGITLNNIALAYESQRWYEEALTTYFEALAILREVDDRAGEGITLNNIAKVYRFQRWYEEALTTYSEVLAIHREVGDRAGEGATLNNIAVVYESQGRYEEALTTFNAALIIRREVGDRAGESTTLHNIGAVYESQGRYEEALTTFNAALIISREVGDRAGEGTTLNSIAAVYDSQGRYEKALTIYSEALIIRREVGDRVGEGITLNNIAVAYHSQGRYEEALTIFDAALTIEREVGDQASEGGTLTGIAGVYKSQGRYEEALTTYFEALAIVREMGDRADEGRTLNNIAGVYQFQRQYEEALTTYSEALAINREVDDRAGEGATLNNIGTTYYAQDQGLEAIRYYEQAVAVFESMRAISGNDAARASFIAQYTSLYHGLLDLYEQEDLLPEAFLVSEQGRARSFLDSKATGYVELNDEALQDLLTQETKSYANRQAIQDALIQARVADPLDPDLIAELEVQLDEAETTYAEAREVIEDRSDQLETLVPSRKTVLTLPETQALLNEQSTLVSFWVLEDRTIAFILTDSSFDVVSIDVTEETLNTQVKAFNDFPEIDSAYPDTATTLYDTLITPIRPYLNTPQLIIVPHQALNYLPFAALTDGQRYLMDAFAITYLPNASMLQFLPGTDAQPVYETALVVGNPTTFSTVENVNCSSDAPNAEQAAQTAADENDDNCLSPLPNAEQAAQTIADLFNTTPLLGDAATETAVRQNVSTANILHLGAHGRYNIVAPMQSAIYLTPGDSEGGVGDNGRLLVQEVYGLPMDNMELVVLSASESNLGYLDRNNPLNNISAGDEIVSLTRAFLFQSPTVISTLWSVDDTATGLLMEQFYTHLLDGTGKADALRLAQLYVRDYGDGEYANPYFWAGFILSGDGGEVDISLLSVAEEATAAVEEEIEEQPSPTVQPPISPEPASAPSPIIWLIPVAILAIVGGFVVRRWRKRPK